MAARAAPAAGAGGGAVEALPGVRALLHTEFSEASYFSAPSGGRHFGRSAHHRVALDEKNPGVLCRGCKAAGKASQSAIGRFDIKVARVPYLSFIFNYHELFWRLYTQSWLKGDFHLKSHTSEIIAPIGQLQPLQGGNRARVANLKDPQAGKYALSHCTSFRAVHELQHGAACVIEFSKQHTKLVAKGAHIAMQA